METELIPTGTTKVSGEVDPMTQARVVDQFMTHTALAGRGGANSIDNYLPACKSCNRLKWHRSPETIRFILQLGTYARKEIEHDTQIGQRLAKIFSRKEKSNGKRRTKKQK